MLSKGALCVACVASVAAAAPPSADAAFPGANGRIAFVSDRDGDNDIYTIKPNGQGVLNLTPGGDDDGAPAWSADGRWIAYASDHRSATNPTGAYELWVVSADGSQRRQVTFDALDADLPAWSPDGKQLAFTRNTGDFPESDILTVRLDGTGERNLTNSPSVADRESSWSPDGQTIAFASDRDGQEFFDIYTMRPNGSSARRLTFTAADEEFPDWSPGGRLIAFNSAGADVEGGEVFEIYTMRPDGRGRLLVTRAAPGESGSALPAWSPDGRKLAVASDRTGDPEIWTLRADGSHQRNRTRSPLSADAFPDWQPVRHHDDD
jgi:Tol biopolymer transport system component